jgi:hypothetical protein
MMRGRLSHVASVALAVCALCASSAAQETGARRAGGQTGTEQSPSRRAASEAAPAEGENQDLSITARVTARELLFRQVPNPRVEFTGRPRRETVWEAERQNLPEQVQPGVTYRDIGITLRITSVFPDIERIVAEALGEIPPSDDAAPATSTPPASPETPPASPSNPTPTATDETRRAPVPPSKGREM